MVREGRQPLGFDVRTQPRCSGSLKTVDMNCVGKGTTQGVTFGYCDTDNSYCQVL